METGRHARRQARQLIREGRPAEAARLLAQVLRDHPEDTRARDYLAAAYYDMGAHDESLEALRRVVEAWPHKARCWRNYAMLLRKVGRLEEAQQACDRALRRDPDYRKAQLEHRKIRRLLRLPVCEACGMPIEPADLRSCAGCGWDYHDDCWLDARGCTNPACRGEQLVITPGGPSAPGPVRRVPARSGCLPWSLLAFLGLAVAVALLAPI